MGLASKGVILAGGWRKERVVGVVFPHPIPLPLLRLVYRKSTGAGEGTLEADALNEFLLAHR
jgi:hypothetical protein